MESIKRKSRPSIEGLEGRMLLTSFHFRDPTLPPSFKPVEVQYTTPRGTQVDLQLTGGGSLKGSSIDSSGDLNLVFSGTTVFSTISAATRGGTGQANLATIRNANVPLNSLSGLNGELIGRVILPSFNLIPGGDVNLTSGVQVFTLNSVAANSQVHLRDTPLNISLNIPSYVNTATGAGSSFAKLSSTSTGATSSSATGLASGTSIGAASGSSSSGLTIIGQGTLNPTAVGFGGGSVGAINGAIPIINTVGNGQNYLGTPGLSQAQVSQGRNLTYVIDGAGGQQLSAIAGTFLPGANLIEPSDISLPPHRVPPPGVVITINHVNGGATAKTPPLSNAQIYGVDAVTNSLIRFDTVTGATLQSIALPASSGGGGVGGISLAANGAELVVLVGIGQNVLAYDAVTGAPAGQFSISSLPPSFSKVTGIGTGNGTTVLEDAADGPNGTLQAINLIQSLASGLAVPVNASFMPNREFGLAGTVTGVPGTGQLYALGAGYFDTAQPNARQAGILTVNPGTTGLSEAARTALTSKGVAIPAGSNNGIASSSSVALGSLDSFLAVDTGVVNGQNVVNLYSPNGLTGEGSITLNDPNSLADLSQSFHPELANTALIDVQGNIQTFSAKTATGLVLNGQGNIDLVQINNASNSSIIGLPFSHVNIPMRTNVVIITNSRLVGTRGGVIVNASQQPVGPLFLNRG